MYDLLYQIYCAKLTAEGQDARRETSLREWIREGHRQRIGRTPEETSDEKIVWWVFMCLAGLMTFVYYICLYFCLNEDSSVDENLLRKKLEDRKRR